MRPATLLLLAALAVFAVVVYRVTTGGVPGPKTAAVTAFGVVLLIASFIARRRAGTTPPAPRA